MALKMLYKTWSIITDQRLRLPPIDNIVIVLKRIDFAPVEDHLEDGYILEEDRIFN